MGMAGQVEAGADRERAKNVGRAEIYIDRARQCEFSFDAGDDLNN